MADRLTAFPDIVSGGSSPSGTMFVDANILINFDRIGALEALLAANRVIIVTPEVYKEAVRDAIATGDPNTAASGERIRNWIQANTGSGNIQTEPVDPDRPMITGKDAGEQSILEDVRSLKGQGNPVILSDDDRSLALQVVDGSTTPVLTGNYYLGSLLTAGAITPGDYFQMSGAGAAAGFNRNVLWPDTSSVYTNGDEYGLIIDGLRQGTVRYTTVGSSSITLDGRPPAYSAPYERVGIQNGEIVRFNSDGSRKIDLNGNEPRSDQTAATNPWQDFGTLNFPDQPSGFNQYDSGNPFLATPMLTSASMLGPNHFPGTAGIFPAFAGGSAGPAYPVAPPDAQLPGLLPLKTGQTAIDPGNILGLPPVQEEFDNRFGLLDQTSLLLYSRPPAPRGGLLEGLPQNSWDNGGAAPGGPFDWRQSNPTDYGWLYPRGNGGAAPGNLLDWPQSNLTGSAGAFPSPAPQTQMTPQQVSAPPPSPFGVPVPPALQPLVEHFFPQGFAAATQLWPSTGISDGAGAQLNAASSTDAGLGLAAGGQLTPQPFAAAPPSPFDVPIPPALLPLVPHFFPQGIDTSNTHAWPSTGTSDGSDTQPNPAGSAGAGLDFTRWPITSQQASAFPA